MLGYPEITEIIKCEKDLPPPQNFLEISDFHVPVFFQAPMISWPFKMIAWIKSGMQKMLGHHQPHILAISLNYNDKEENKESYGKNNCDY